jgi:hypothetical protein
MDPLKTLESVTSTGKYFFTYELRLEVGYIVWDVAIPKLIENIKKELCKKLLY